jgi:hypothetical protein
MSPAKPIGVVLAITPSGTRPLFTCGLRNRDDGDRAPYRWKYRDSGKRWLFLLNPVRI